jgi:hypothetical protein
MAKDKLTDYNATAASNTDIGGVSLAEGGMQVSDINNAFREQMSHLKDFANGTTGIDVLNLQDDDASASIKLQAPATVTTTTTFTMPDGDGTNGQFLKTDGAGALSFGGVASDSIGADELDVTGNGTSGQALLSDGDGTMTWGTIAGYPQVITVLTTGTSYTIPSNAKAILIRASGGGGGGAVHANPAIGGLGTNTYTQGDPGDPTTVTNTTLGISINAPGGSRGSVGGSMTTSQWHTNQGTASGGDVFWNHGASGGRTTGNNFDNSQEDGAKGCLVQKYVTGSNVGGEVLTYSLGDGGNSTNSGGTRQPEDGQNGYLELWIW